MGFQSEAIIVSLIDENNTTIYKRRAFFNDKKAMKELFFDLKERLNIKSYGIRIISDKDDDWFS